MKSGFKHIAHSFICLLLCWQLFNLSADTGRFLSYIFQLYQQANHLPDDNSLAEAADLCLELDLEDCTGAENDESEACEEESGTLDVFYTYPDAFALRHALAVSKGILTPSFEINPESITLDTAFPPPEV